MGRCFILSRAEKAKQQRVKERALKLACKFGVNTKAADFHFDRAKGEILPVKERWVFTMKQMNNE